MASGRREDDDRAFCITKAPAFRGEFIRGKMSGKWIYTLAVTFKEVCALSIRQVEKSPPNASAQESAPKSFPK